MKRTQRVAIAAVASVLTLMTVFVGYPRYRAASDLAEKKHAISQAIAKDAAFTETLAKWDRDSADSTVKELLDFCDKSIDQRTMLIVEMRVETAALPPKTGATVLAFLNAENDFARNRKAFLLSMLEFNAAAELMGKSMAKLDGTREGLDAILRHFQRTGDSSGAGRAEALLAEEEAGLAQAPAIARRANASHRALRKAADDFRNASETLKASEDAMGRAMAAAGIAFRSVFAPYYSRSIEKAHQAQAKVKV